MESKLCFTAVEFPDDPNVAGLKYWYLCPYENAAVGMGAVAPLGKHNRLQTGVVREVRFCLAEDAPYPINLIKSIQKLVVNNSRN